MKDRYTTLLKTNETYKQLLEKKEFNENLEDIEKLKD